MKVEISMQYFDEWMVRWRHYQTAGDWQIEKNRQWWRQFNYAVSAAIGVGLVCFTMKHGTIRRHCGPQGPHFFDNGIDTHIKSIIFGKMINAQRYTPSGFGRLVTTTVPAYGFLAVSEHRAEQRRHDQYIAQDTVFGEQLRRFHKSGKIEEMLPVNIQATLPENESIIYAQ